MSISLLQRHTSYIAQSCPADPLAWPFPSIILDPLRRAHRHSRQDSDAGFVVTLESVDLGLLQTYGKLMAIDPRCSQSPTSKPRIHTREGGIVLVEELCGASVAIDFGRRQHLTLKRYQSISDSTRRHLVISAIYKLPPHILIFSSGVPGADLKIRPCTLEFKGIYRSHFQSFNNTVRVAVFDGRASYRPG